MKGEKLQSLVYMYMTVKTFKLRQEIHLSMLSIIFFKNKSTDQFHKGAGSEGYHDHPLHNKF